MSVGTQYIPSWLRGVGRIAPSTLMGDAATGEVSHSQVRRWARHGARLKEGPPATAAPVHKIEEDELSFPGDP